MNLKKASIVIAVMLILLIGIIIVVFRKESNNVDALPGKTCGGSKPDAKKCISGYICKFPFPECDGCEGICVSDKVSDVVEKDYYLCLTDNECVTVRADGCGCTAGGSNTSINQKYKTEWEEVHPAQMCPAVMSKNASCIGVAPKCVSGRCKLSPDN